MADRFFKKLVGMMFRSNFPQDYVLWIHSCNSVQTTFMKLPIDVVFVNKDLVVEKIYWNLSPWKFTWPSSKYKSVFEFPAGSLKPEKLQIGDQLRVEA